MSIKDRGFASMDSSKQREIASRGGKAAHEKGTAHEFNADEARKAGHKGGQSVSQDREHMRRIGSLGGKTRSQNRQHANPVFSGPDAAGVAGGYFSEENDLMDVE